MAKEAGSPSPGHSLNLADVDGIARSLLDREAIFPSEVFEQRLAIVLLNYGDKYTPITCVNGEWHGHKSDIPFGRGIPKCPNGHVMVEGQQMRLGWVSG